jgi:4-amino-4-deoxy-L-arabinose transferase-like glycosyltransferase
VAAVRTLYLRPIFVVIGLKSALNLAFASRYGWQRDELYYAVAGRHLQGGYVEFPPVTALFSALARIVFGDSLTGFRLFAILAGAGSTFVAALIARELGGSRRAQLLAAVVVGFSPLLVATNGLFQPVSFDQLTTLLFLWLAIRLALGHGPWALIGVVAGIGLETKYTLAVVLVITLAGFAALRRELLEPWRLALALGLVLVIMAPNLAWEMRHNWISVGWFLNPPPSATDESRLQFVANVLLLTHIVAIPVAVAGVFTLWRRPELRALAFVPPAALVTYFVLGGKSYYALPVVMFALACGAVSLDRWADTGRLRLFGTAFAALLAVMLPIGLPVLPLKTAATLGILDARHDYRDEVGWPQLAANVGRLAKGSDVVLTRNYGEAGALEMFGKGLPPVASAHVTFRYWRPVVHGSQALLVGFKRSDASFCTSYRVLGHVQMPVENEERGRQIATCQLSAPLANVWPKVVALYTEIS